MRSPLWHCKLLRGRVCSVRRGDCIAVPFYRGENQLQSSRTAHSNQVQRLWNAAMSPKMRSIDQRGCFRGKPAFLMVQTSFSPRALNTAPESLGRSGPQPLSLGSEHSRCHLDVPTSSEKWSPMDGLSKWDAQNLLVKISVDQRLPSFLPPKQQS